MAHIRRQDAFDDSDYVSCPAGGDWWKCEDINYPTFIGCCSTNPCSGQMCPEEDLHPMGFGSVTSPAPDYPNHSCPYGGLWYTCADNSVTFQGCCESNPCNGVGCPALDLRAAAVHTVDVAGASTFTVPSSVATATPTDTTSPAIATITSSQASQASKSAFPQSASKSVDTAAIAGGAAAAAILLTLAVGLAVYYLIRRSRMKQLTQESIRSGVPPPDFKPFYKDPFGAVMTPLPRYSRRTPSFAYPQGPFSPAPTYRSTHPPHTEPQEVMGLGLSEDEFSRRTKSRSPINYLVGDPVELATQRFSANNPDAEMKSPLLESTPRSKPKPKPKPKSRARREEKRDRQSRLRSRLAIADLRGEASRSRSRSLARSFESND